MIIGKEKTKAALIGLTLTLAASQLEAKEKAKEKTPPLELASQVLLFTKADSKLATCTKENDAKLYQCSYENEEEGFTLEYFRVGRNLLFRDNQSGCIYSGSLTAEGLTGTYQCKGMNKKEGFSLFNQ